LNILVFVFHDNGIVAK